MLTTQKNADDNYNKKGGGGITYLISWGKKEVTGQVLCDLTVQYIRNFSVSSLELREIALVAQ